MRVATENLEGMLRERNAQTIWAIVQRTLVKAEREAPPQSQGAFIVANSAFDAFAAVRRVLRSAQADVLLVDPNAEAKTLTDVCVLAPDNIVAAVGRQANHRHRSNGRRGAGWSSSEPRGRCSCARCSGS
jgi:hypothetical protein